MYGYEMCREAVERCRLEKPIVCEPFVILFDAKGLANVRDEYGMELYGKVMYDIAEEEGA